MKDWFFYQDRGKTVGPVSLAEMKQRIRDGQLRLFDLIYKDGEQIWEIAAEHPDLKSEFKTNSELAKGRPWVCLQRKESAADEFLTMGPYSSDEVRALIREGKILYSDYVWREGFKEWKRIGSIEDFNGKANRKKVAPPVEEKPEDLLKAVVQLRRPKVVAAAVEEVPPEAVTPDLTLASVPPDPPPPRKERRARPRPEPTPPPKKAGFKVPFNTESRWIDGLLVLFLLIALTNAAFWLAHKVQDRANSEPALSEQIRVEAPAQPPEEIEKDPPLPSVKSRAPTELSLAVELAGGVAPARIEVRSDGSPDYPVLVQVIGLPGQLVDAPAFYQFLKIKPSGDPNQPLDLGGLKLPAGRFILRAETGRLRKEKQISIGINESSYKAALSKARKAHAHAIWRDRVNLMNVGRLLEQRLVVALKGKQKLQIKGLESLGALKKSNGADYVLFQDWWDLKEIFESARVNPSLTALEQVRQFRERLSSFSVWSYK